MYWGIYIPCYIVIHFEPLPKCIQKFMLDFLTLHTFVKKKSKVKE